MLEDGEQEGLAAGLRHRVAQHVEALAHVVQVEPHVVEALRKLVKVLLAVLVEHLQLHLQVHVLAPAQFLFE